MTASAENSDIDIIGMKIKKNRHNNGGFISRSEKLLYFALKQRKDEIKTLKSSIIKFFSKVLFGYFFSERKSNAVGVSLCIVFDI